MHGLPEDIDLDFLVGCAVVEVRGTEFQTVLILEGGGEVSIESDTIVDGAQTRLAELPAQLRPFVGSRINQVERRGRGDLLLVFDRGRSVLLQDANENYESYTITSPGVTIVV